MRLCDHLVLSEFASEIKIYFLDALRLYKEIEDDGKENTRIAYMLKCIGDLIVEFKEDIWEKGNCVQYDFEGKVLEIVPKDQNDRQGAGKEWFRAASDYYLKAFLCYCCHINWRGLANVLQAMGTCLRVTDQDEIKAGSRKVESIYSLAEECYRWLGDVRGLADTLDYFGHYYNGIMDENRTGNIENAIVTKENVVYKYMALSKWKESRKVWDQQGNGDKASAVGGYKELLERKINAYLKVESASKTDVLQVNESEKTRQEDSQGKKYEEKCNAQRYYLDQMKKSLDLADDLKTKITNSTGNAYELLSAEIDHQFGEYWFKQSQYYTENLRYRDSREADEKKELVREEEELKKEELRGGGAILQKRP